METRTFQVPNIGCDNCVRTIKSELSAITGVSKVEGTVASKTVTVEYSAPASWPQIVEVLTEIDYAPAEA